MQSGMGAEEELDLHLQLVEHLTARRQEHQVKNEGLVLRLGNLGGVKYLGRLTRTMMSLKQKRPPDNG
jgi:hypothetical protein